MSDQPPPALCTVTGGSGTVEIVSPAVGRIILSPAHAVEISHRLLEAAALANGHQAWHRR